MFKNIAPDKISKAKETARKWAINGLILGVVGFSVPCVVHLAHNFRNKIIEIGDAKWEQRCEEVTNELRKKIIRVINQK